MERRRRRLREKIRRKREKSMSEWKRNDFVRKFIDELYYNLFFTAVHGGCERKKLLGGREMKIEKVFSCGAQISFFLSTVVVCWYCVITTQDNNKMIFFSLSLSFAIATATTRFLWLKINTLQAIFSFCYLRKGFFYHHSR